MKFEIIKKSVLLGILIILLVIYYGMDNPKVERTYELKKDNAIAVMVYDETTEDYVSQESIPTGMYQLNKDKTYCVNGGKVNSYNNSLGKLNYTLNTDDKCYVYFDAFVPPKLSETVLALADGTDRTSITNGSVYRVIDQEAKIPDTSSSYTKLTQSQYGTTSEYLGSSNTSTTGTTTTGMFDYNTSDNTWKNDTTNMATSSYYHLKIPVTEDGYYQICYKVTSRADTNYLYAYVTDSSFSTSGIEILSQELRTTSSSFKCTALGELTTDHGIRIVNRTDTSKAAVTFYLQKAPIQIVSTGIRYEGANPDNYVTYNDEEWRIIGVFDGTDIGFQNGKKYTKIIRSSSFNATYQWNEEIYVDPSEECPGGEVPEPSGLCPPYAYWTEASLNTMLNNDYLNQNGSFSGAAIDKGLSSDARGMIAQYDGNYSKWYLGGVVNTYNTDSSNEWYTHERGNIGVGSTTDPNKLSTNAAIGLMYPSDYGYAMYGGESVTNCINTRTKLYSGGYDSCEQYDWLYLSGKIQWTITPNPSGYGVSFVFTVSSTGDVASTTVGGAYYARAVRPVLYLESDVTVGDGNGSQENPYKLSM